MAGKQARNNASAAFKKLGKSSVLWDDVRKEN
jgi:hypothetical protein